MQVDLEGPLPVQPGDTFLLCSDGLSGQVKDDEIGVVLGCLPPAEAARALVDLANLRGGPDNITAMIVRVLGPQVAQARQQSAAPLRTKYRPVHPLLWIFLGVAGWPRLGLGGDGRSLAGMLSFLAAVGALMAALVRRYGGGVDQTSWENRRLGHGPYVTADATATVDLVARLTGVAQQLREASAAEKWSVDWTEFDRRLTQSQMAVHTHDLTAAAREQLRAISSIMSQLRRPPEATSDSGVIRL